MRLSVTIALLLASQLVWSQLAIKPIAQPKRNSVATKVVSPASLPFWDDFSVSDAMVDPIRIWGSDTTSQWDLENSKDVFVNATLAINPPTYNVVTFDGLDGNGGFRADSLGFADQLQSDTIDLSGYNETADSIWISFYWQSGGNVEKPDKRDSLRLQFYNPTDGWVTFWSEKGSEEKQKSDTIFIHEMRPVEQAFLTDEFVFRFQSFGDLTGPFDAWHLDWIYLNRGRSEDEMSEGYRDRAFSGQFKTLFSPYTSIPLNQLRNNLDKYIGDQSILLSNLDAENPQPISYRHEILDSESMSSLFLNPVEEVNPLLLANTIQEVPLDTIALSGLPPEDSIVLRSSVQILNSKDSLLSAPIDLKINDQINQEYLLQNFYAYDDGTAEYAAGTNVANGQVAVKFWLEEQDTMTHVAFHFPNIAPSAKGKSLTLRILKSLDENGSVIRAQQINVNPDSVINGFTYYELVRPLVVSDTFYVSYQQNTNDYIGIGFDRSNMEASDYIFENKGDGWEKNVLIKGALMIRPIFKNVKDFTLGNNEQPQKLTIFPNPTDGYLSIKGQYMSIDVMGISGKILFREEAKSVHDLTNLEGGLYLLRIHQLDGDRTYKIIKK